MDYPAWDNYVRAVFRVLNTRAALEEIRAYWYRCRAIGQPTPFDAVDEFEEYLHDLVEDRAIRRLMGE